MQSIPYDECTKAAQALALDGATIYQKWTCAGCGETVTANKANHWTEMGHHEDCGHVTNMREQGCNYMLIKRLT
jgi:hypothetical protein